jgi:hypothetical protein
VAEIAFEPGNTVPSWSAAGEVQLFVNDMLLATVTVTVVPTVAAKASPAIPTSSTPTASTDETTTADRLRRRGHRRARNPDPLAERARIRVTSANPAMT